MLCKRQKWTGSKIIFCSDWHIIVVVGFGAHCKSHHMINYLKYEHCDTIDSTRGHPLCYLSRFNLTTGRICENPRIQIEIFGSHWTEPNENFYSVAVGKTKTNWQSWGKKTVHIISLFPIACKFSRRYLAHKGISSTHKFKQNHWPIKIAKFVISQRKKENLCRAFFSRIIYAFKIFILFVIRIAEK